MMLQRDTAVESPWFFVTPYNAVNLLRLWPMRIEAVVCIDFANFSTGDYLNLVVIQAMALAYAFKKLFHEQPQPFFL